MAEVFPLPVKGGQDKPSPAATGTTVPFPPASQGNAITRFSQPSHGASRQAMACPCMHPLTQDGAQSCTQRSASSTEPHATTQPAEAREGRSWKVIRPSLFQQGGHTPPHLSPAPRGRFPHLLLPAPICWSTEQLFQCSSKKCRPSPCALSAYVPVTSPPVPSARGSLARGGREEGRQRGGWG